MCWKVLVHFTSSLYAYMGIFFLRFSGPMYGQLLFKIRFSSCMISVLVRYLFYLYIRYSATLGHSISQPNILRSMWKYKVYSFNIHVRSLGIACYSPSSFFHNYLDPLLSVLYHIQTACTIIPHHIYSFIISSIILEN